MHFMSINQSIGPVLLSNRLHFVCFKQATRVSSFRPSVGQVELMRFDLITFIRTYHFGNPW